MKALRKSDEPAAIFPWLEEVVACLRDNKPVRKELDGGGRLHIDRALPFLCVHITPEGEQPVARDIVQSNASYLIAPGIEAALPIIDTIGRVLERQFGAFMIMSIEELENDDLLTNDAPYLPPFRIEVEASTNLAASAAATAFVKAVESIESKFRTAQTERVKASATPTTIAGGLKIPFPFLSVRFAPIYRKPNSEKTYPELRERLSVNMFDAGLQALGAFINASKSMNITTHRALGRRAFIDAVVRADRSIDQIASSFDFLLSVTPINAQAAWKEFTENGCRATPRFLYRPLEVQIDNAKRKLFSIAFDHLEDPVLHHLYREKQQELDLQLTMLSARQTTQFMEFGRALYGAVEQPLLYEAEEILARTTTGIAPDEQLDNGENMVDCYFIDHRAGMMIADYRRKYPGFDAMVELRDDLPPGLLVSGNKLLISRRTRMNRHRVAALLNHEIGVHLLTYFNGTAQGLRLFRSGLSGYESMQEGLAVFAEYLAGGMREDRLRLLAARVVGCTAMLNGASFAETYALLVREYGFEEAAAFNLALRLYRGGGLAKDAIYLRGLLQLLQHLRAGGALEPFWMGKIASSHFQIMQELAVRGLLHRPVVQPEFLDYPGADDRLTNAKAGMSPLDMLEHQEP